jgi:hypothetical protein
VPSAFTIVSTGAEAFELVTVTRFGMFPLFSSGVQRLHLMIQRCHGRDHVRVRAFKNGIFPERRIPRVDEVNDAVSEWINASHTSDVVCTGVGPSAVPALMTVVSKSVQAA